MIHHYGEVYGTKPFFTKSLLKHLKNKTMTALCAEEQTFIRESKVEAKKDGTHSINYTGANRRDSAFPSTRYDNTEPQSANGFFPK